MKSTIVATVGLFMVAMTAVAFGQDAPKASAPALAPPAELKDMKSKASYSIGLLMGRNIKNLTTDIDVDLVMKGFKDSLAGTKALLTDEQVQQVLQTFQKEAMTKKLAELKKEGDDFLAANKTKPGVVTLASGLQYKVVKEGTGKVPKATDTVSAHYRGTLINGNEFDSSYKRGAPLKIAVNGVIPGWTEALQKMKVGSKWQLFIPSDLAYGPNPQQGSPIPPNSALVFDIELLGIE